MKKNGTKAILAADVKLSVSTIIDIMAKDGKKAATDTIIAADREMLDLFTKQIAGKAPHPSHDTDKVRAHLIRWAAGDKNWMYDEHKDNGKSTLNAETVKVNDTKGEVEMKKNGTKKSNGKKAAARKAGLAPKTDMKPAPKEAKKSNGGDTHLKGKSGKTRSTWFRDALLANKKEKMSDTKILKDAIAEFGEKNVGEGTRYTVKKMRSNAIYDSAHKKFGLKPSDGPFVKHAD